MINPSRDLPRIVHTAVPLTVGTRLTVPSDFEGLFLLANIGYFTVLPVQLIARSTTLAMVRYV